MRLALASFVLTLSLLAQTTTSTVTVQEEIFPGTMTGIARTADVYTLGIPLPDVAGGITCSNLTASSGTFQCVTIATWPASGRPMWLRLDGTASVSAGGTATVTLGSAGSNTACASGATYSASCATAGAMGSDNGTLITVNTGAATVTIKKANYSVVESATVGGTNLLTAGSPGIVLTGPAYPATTCATPPSTECTTLYQSSNDASSTVILEENGPVKTVVLAKGALVDGSGNVYMRYTQRLYFYAGRTGVGIKTLLRNADLSTTTNFASAYKGYRSLEIRETPALASGKAFSFANATGTPTSASYVGSEDAYLYEGFQNMWVAGSPNAIESQIGNASATYPVTMNSTGTSTAQNGFEIRQGATDLLYQPSLTAFNQGWGELHDSTGAGITVGIWEMAQGWPASLEFRAGGTDLRIGLRPDQNLWQATCTSGITPCQIPYAQSWPHWNYLEPAFLEFHSGAETTTQSSNAFLSWQHPLVARADLATYNTSKLLFHHIPDPTAEDSYYKSMAAAASVTTGTCKSTACTLADVTPVRYWWVAWSAPSASNQFDFRDIEIRQFLQRGLPGRLVGAWQYARHVVTEASPASDGFTWTDYWKQFGVSGNYLDARGQITGITSTNAATYKQNMDSDTEHRYHWSLIDWYLTQGDEFLRDWILDSYKDFFSAVWNYSWYSDASGCGGTGFPFNSMGGYGCHAWPERALGNMVANTSHLEVLLKGIGDPITSVTCPAAIAGTPTVTMACDPMQLATRVVNDSWEHDVVDEGYGEANRYLFGRSPTRGYYVGYLPPTVPTCGSGSYSVVLEFFFQGILLNGMQEFYRANDMLALSSGWANYADIQERMYGSAQWMLRQGMNGSGASAVGMPYPPIPPTSYTNIANEYATFVGTDDGGANCSASYINASSASQDFIPGWTVSHEYGDRSFDGLMDTWIQAAIKNNSATYYSSFYDQTGYQLQEALGYRLTNPNAYNQLQTVTPSNFTDNGGGSYTFTWSPPTGTTGYKFKRCSYGGVEHTCTEWLAYNWVTATFVDDPTAKWPWFSSLALTPPSADATTITVTGQPTGLTASNFELKAQTSGLTNALLSGKTGLSGVVVVR